MRCREDGKQRTSNISITKGIGASLALSSGGGRDELLTLGQGVEAIGEALVELSRDSSRAQKKGGEGDLREAHSETMVVVDSSWVVFGFCLRGELEIIWVGIGTS